MRSWSKKYAYRSKRRWNKDNKTYSSNSNFTFASNQLISVAIGASVDIIALFANSTTMGTNEGFKTVYDAGGKQAGTYNYSGGGMD